MMIIAFAILTDVSCTLLPIAVLWNVQMKWRLKLAVSGLMSLGLVATTAAAVRAYYSDTLNGTEDSTWNLAYITIWAIVEIHFAVIGGNFALARFIYRYFRDDCRTTRKWGQRWKTIHTSLPLFSGRTSSSTSGHVESVREQAPGTTVNEHQGRELHHSDSHIGLTTDVFVYVSNDGLSDGNREQHLANRADPGWGRT